MKDIFLLDLDETLLDFLRAERENLSRTLTRLGIPPSERILRRFHEINDALWKSLERGEITRERLTVERFARLFAEFSLPTDAGAAAEAYFRGFADVCYPFEGALEFLGALRERGRSYVVTNGATTIQRRHIADAGFSPFLDGLFISEEIGFQKPDERFAEYVESHIPHYGRARAVWLGDSLTSDWECAKRRGIGFVLYASRGAPPHYSGAWAKNYGEVLRLFGEM